jgi:hypothetical protein
MVRKVQTLARRSPLDLQTIVSPRSDVLKKYDSIVVCKSFENQFKFLEQQKCLPPQQVTVSIRLARITTRPFM